jgi:hypothetical protein
VKQDESNWSLQQQLDLEANCQSHEGKTEDNHENGKEYVGITKTHIEI